MKKSKLGEVLSISSMSVIPQAGITYKLYSLPSFDDGQEPETAGSETIQSNKYVVPTRCILFNKLNVRFKRIWRINNNIPNKLCSTEFLPLVINEDLIDYQYCYYLLASDYLTNYLCGINSNTSGSHKRINPDILLSVDVALPTLNEQKRIGSMLANLDRKIEISRAINHNLEAIAKQLYDYWFVQFDFPNTEGKPYKSSGGKMVWNEKLKREIPEEWHCGNLFEIATFTNGLACQKFRPKDGEVPLPVIKIREMHDGISSDTEEVSPNIPESVKVYNGDVLFSWSASLEVMLWACGLGGLNQHIFKVTSANDFPKSFYYFQLLNYVDIFKKMAEARKTTMGHITQDHLQQSTIAIPDNKDIVDKFEKRISPIFAQMVKLQEEIQQLSKQRDELLPLLMNGQASLNYDLSAFNSVFSQTILSIALLAVAV